MDINSYQGFCFSHSWDDSLLLLVQWFSMIPLYILCRWYYIFSYFLWFNSMSQMLPVVCLDQLPILRIVTVRCNKWSLFTRWTVKNALKNDFRMFHEEKPTNKEVHFYLNVLLKHGLLAFPPFSLAPVTLSSVTCHLMGEIKSVLGWQY